MVKLTGQVVLITGGSRGIGAATAVMFAKADADVAITYQKDKKAALTVLQKIHQLGREGIAVRCNVANFADVKKAVTQVYKNFGKIDVLVNNAGVWTFGQVERMSEKVWDKTINANLKGTFNMCKAVVSIMKKQKYGRIINVSSTAGQRGEAFHSHYAASKGGVNAFTKSLGAELISEGIWVNCVAPGWVVTDMTSFELKQRKTKIAIEQSIPRGKIASPEEIAGPILFLASELSNNIVGEILNVNGGSVLCG
jgi:3-oxoacyl-[acyl-carrier protein] reductase